jgi:hypothetical protein
VFLVRLFGLQFRSLLFVSLYLAAVFFCWKYKSFGDKGSGHWGYHTCSFKLNSIAAVEVLRSVWTAPLLVFETDCLEQRESFLRN